MSSTIVLATHNRAKGAELSAFLNHTYTVKTLSEIGFISDIPETAETFEANARIKAAAVWKYLQANRLEWDLLADDSGLEVEALNGAPGVMSARFAGELKNDTANIKLLLSQLKTHTHRKARFVCALVLIQASGSCLFEGTVSGSIAYEPRGANGFGYDSVFIPTGYRSTFAELNAEQKNQISHRAVAMKKLKEYLSNNTTMGC